MTDVFREVDEALREDRAKAFWRRYGNVVIAAAVVVVVAVGGWNLWQRYQTGRHEDETDRLTAALKGADTDANAAIAQLAAVAGDADTSHAVLAKLAEAGLKAKQGDRDGAVALYREVSGDSGAMTVWRDLARLLAVMHDLDNGDPAAMRDEIAPLTADDSPWRFSARELTALLALRQGDTGTAGPLFAALAGDNDAPAGVRQRASELAKLLGVAPTASAPPPATPDEAAPAPETPS